MAISVIGGGDSSRVPVTRKINGNELTEDITLSLDNIEGDVDGDDRKLQLRRGTKANLPTLASGELGFCTDTKEIYVGDGSANTLVGGGITLTGALAAGSTSLTLSNSLITTDSTIDIYTSTYGVNPASVTLSAGKVVLTFEAQSAALNVKVEVRS